MAKTTIYTITITEAKDRSEEGTHYSLDPWLADSRYCTGYDDGGKVYELPKGVGVGRYNDGTRFLYEKNSGREVKIHTMNGVLMLKYGNRKYFIKN